MPHSCKLHQDITSGIWKSCGDLPPASGTWQPTAEICQPAVDLPLSSGTCHPLQGPATLCGDHPGKHGDLPPSCMQNTLSCPMRGVQVQHLAHVPWGSATRPWGHHGPACWCPCSGLALDTAVRTNLVLRRHSWKLPWRWLRDGAGRCLGVQQRPPAPASPSSPGRMWPAASCAVTFSVSKSSCTGTWAPARSRQSRASARPSSATVILSRSGCGQDRLHPPL